MFTKNRAGSWTAAILLCSVLEFACLASSTPSPGADNGGGSGGESGAGGSAGAGEDRGSGGTAKSDGAGGASDSGGASGAGGTTTKGGAGGRQSSSGGAPGSGGDTGPGGRQNTGGNTGDTGGSTANPDAGTTTSGITDLRVEANAKNVLSCFVRWKTAAPADSTVQFGVGKYEWRISEDKQVTDHKVLVIGMRASTSYVIKAISSIGGSEASAEDKFTTGALPSSIPVATIGAIDVTEMQPGWTLMNIQKGDGTATAQSKTPAMAVMYDEEGQPVWYYIDGNTVDRGGAIPVELTDKGVLIGAVMDASVTNAQPPREVDFAGNTLWECSTPSCGSGGNITHHASKLPNGNYIIQRDVTSGNGTSPVYEEVTHDNKVVWTLDYRKFVAPPAGAMGDWCHGNSITMNIEKNEVHANCRFMGLIKTTYQNPTLLWHLPASYGAKNMGDMKFSPTTSQYSDTHDPEIHDDGTILFFDNGGYSGVIGEEGNPHGYQSRVLEYRIDETAKTATLTWEFPGSFNVDSWYKTDFYLPFWGDADRLANGNVLVTAGVRGTKVQSRIFEVTKQDGKVVWEFKLPPDYGVYRSERLSPPPLVSPIEQ